MSFMFTWHTQSLGVSAWTVWGMVVGVMFCPTADHVGTVGQSSEFKCIFVAPSYGVLSALICFML
jgi:hypothetical protein